MALNHCNLLCNCPRASSGAGAGTSPSAGELAVDEGERSLAILGAVILGGCWRRSHCSSKDPQRRNKTGFCWPRGMKTQRYERQTIHSSINVPYDRNSDLDKRYAD